MKKFSVIFVLFISLISCEKPSDCVESTGDTVTKDVEVLAFTRLEVYKGIEVVITQGTDYKVQIKTGENLINNIEVSQEGTVLKLRDNTTCNWVRDYGQTIVYVTAPNIEEIYSKTEKNISSNGVLTYPLLRLFALDEDVDGKKGAGTGDFYITVNNSQLVIENNSVSRYFISGATGEGLFSIYASDGRIDASGLMAQTIKLYHRGSNDMILNSIQSVSGKIVSTGNVILKNNPPIVDVQELYQGRIIYN